MFNLHNNAILFLGFLSIGIASITRPSNTNYLLNTTKSLMDNLSEMDEEETYIVIFLADLHEPSRSTRAAELSRTFSKYIDKGLLTVIVAYPEYYPPLDNIKPRFGDSSERRFWRAKQNVDTAFVMCYCKDTSQFYIHLEDDAIPSPSFFPKLKAFLTENDGAFLVLDVARKGNVAKLYHSKDLSNSASFFFLMYDEMPVDWLLPHLRAIKEPAKMRKLPLAASLFQHTGILSSLAEKKPKGPGHEEPFFDLYDQKFRGLNPPAKVTSPLSSHETVSKGSPQHAYEKGSGYFWGTAPSKDDYVIVKFKESTAVQKVFVDTGSLLGRKDILKSGVLQASFESVDQEEFLRESGDHGCGNFETCGSFSKGKVTVTFNNSKKLTCLRILAKENQDEPLFLREIDVWA